MGFFSWMTQDTNKSIANAYSNRDTFKVHMIDNKGNVFTEENYEGYGDFGGKDYYELLAEMNGFKDRNDGIDIKYNNKIQNPIFPNLVEDRNWEWRNECPESCPDQGYFYYNEDDEDDFN